MIISWLCLKTHAIKFCTWPGSDNCMNCIHKEAYLNCGNSKNNRSSNCNSNSNTNVRIKTNMQTNKYFNTNLNTDFHINNHNTNSNIVIKKTNLPNLFIAGKQQIFQNSLFSFAPELYLFGGLINQVVRLKNQMCLLQMIYKPSKLSSINLVYFAT